MAQQIPRFGSRIISFISTWPVVTIYMPSNTSHSNSRDRPGIGSTACQQTQSVLGRTWKPHSSTNFQGTYVRPPDADCPDAEALAAFKHNIATSGLPGTWDRKSRNLWQPSRHS